MEFEPGICTFCGTGCGHFLRIADGRIRGVFPSRNHPVSRGRLCIRGWNVHELLDTRQRIIQPLIRNQKGLRPVSLDTAFSEFVARVPGRAESDEIAVLGSPRATNEEQYLLMKFARMVLRTGNISVDSEGGHGNALKILQETTRFPGMHSSISNIRNTDLLMVVDFDITRQNPIIGSELHYAARSGSNLITIDSRVTQIARLSRSFLHIQPGSTIGLIQALCKSLIEQGCVDRSWHFNRTIGLNQLEQQLSELDIEKTASETGLALDTIDTIALQLAEAETAKLFFPSGISGITEDTVAWLYNLFLLAGKVGRPGCGVNPVSGLNNLQGAVDMGLQSDCLTGFQPVSDPEVVNRFQNVWGESFQINQGTDVYQILSSGEPLKALLVMDHDEGIVRYSDRISEIDTVVYFGAYDNPFTEFADIVFPIATCVETDGTFTNAERRVQLSQKKIEPPEGVFPATHLFAQLAMACGQKWELLEADQIMDEIAILTPFYRGISYSKLSQTQGIQWPCASDSPQGTEEFVHQDEAKMVFAEVTRKGSVATTSEEFPFLLMIGKAQHFWHQNNLMKKTFIPMREYNATLLLYPKGYVEICPQDAEELKVKDSWTVRICSSEGSMLVSVKVSEDVNPKTAFIPYFISDMISQFLLEHRTDFQMGENASIPIKIERVR